MTSPCLHESTINMIKDDTKEIKSDVKLLLAAHHRREGEIAERKRTINRRFKTLVKIIVPIIIAIIGVFKF